MTETDIQSASAIVLCEEGGRGWRNQILERAYTADGKLVGKCGFGVGSSDYIGIFHGRFLAIEFKRPGQKPRPDQWKWLRMIVAMGGVAIVCRDPEGLRALLQRLRTGDLPEGFVHEC